MMRVSVYLRFASLGLLCCLLLLSPAAFAAPSAREDEPLDQDLRELIESAKQAAADPIYVNFGEGSPRALEESEAPTPAPATPTESPTTAEEDDDAVGPSDAAWRGAAPSIALAAAACLGAAVTLV